MIPEMKIIQEIAGEGKVLETHSSAVLLTEQYAYKIKKPVYFGFLDYRTGRLRRMYCILEKELNSKFCSGIYLDVQKLVKTSEGYNLTGLENSFPALEYVLKMKRIPDSDFLHNKILNNEITDDKMAAIGYEIAIKLKNTANAPSLADGFESSFEAVAYNIEENFRQLQELCTNENRLDFIEKTAFSFLRDNKNLFINRYRDGYIKDGHGDLRLEHVFLNDENNSGLIDCIEFSERLRFNDIISEAAFISMELDSIKKIELSDAFLNGFFSVFSDKESIFLLNFYKCYRAVVRAKVALLSIKGKEADDGFRSAKLSEYHRLMDCAYLYAISMNKAFTLVFCGMIATGKSTNASAFADKYPVAALNTDQTRKLMAGLKPEDNRVQDYNKGIYSPEYTGKVYKYMADFSEKCIKTGRVSVLDGTFLLKYQQNLLKSFNPFFISFELSDEKIKERLKRREGSVSITDGRLLHFDEMKKTSDIVPDLSLQGDNPINNNIKEIETFLTKI